MLARYAWAVSPLSPAGRNAPHPCPSPKPHCHPCPVVRAIRAAGTGRGKAHCAAARLRAGRDCSKGPAGAATSLRARPARCTHIGVDCALRQPWQRGDRRARGGAGTALSRTQPVFVERHLLARNHALAVISLHARTRAMLRSSASRHAGFFTIAAGLQPAGTAS